MDILENTREVSGVRHLPVEHNINKNANKKMCGRHDTEPTPEGIQMAENLHKEIIENKDLPESLRNPDIIICSPEGRAKKTLEKLYPETKALIELAKLYPETKTLMTLAKLYTGTKTKILISELADERTYGKWDGRTVEELIREHNLSSEAVNNFRNVFTFEHDRTIPTAENLFDVEKRAKELCKLINKLGGKNVVVISHVAFLKIFDGVIRGLSREEMVKTVIKNCEPFTLRKGENGIFDRVDLNRK